MIEIVRNVIKYRDMSGAERELVLMPSGPAVPANAEQIAKNEHGFTNPDLHRKIETNGTQGEGEVAPRQYGLTISGTHSYQTTKYVTHDEESTASEIP